MDTHLGHPCPGPFSTPRHSLILFPKCLKNLIMFIHSGCHHPGPSLQHPLSCSLAMSCFWSLHMFQPASNSFASRQPGWWLKNANLIPLFMLLSTTQCFPFLLEWRLKSPTLPTRHLASLLSLSMFQLTHFFSFNSLFPLAAHFEIISDMQNIAKIGKDFSYVLHSASLNVNNLYNRV